jgi:hypothetical protein
MNVQTKQNNPSLYDDIKKIFRESVSHFIHKQINGAQGEVNRSVEEENNFKVLIDDYNHFKIVSFVLSEIY